MIYIHRTITVDSFYIFARRAGSLAYEHAACRWEYHAQVIACDAASMLCATCSCMNSLRERLVKIRGVAGEAIRNLMGWIALLTDTVGHALMPNSILFYTVTTARIHHLSQDQVKTRTWARRLLADRFVSREQRCGQGFAWSWQKGKYID